MCRWELDAPELPEHVAVVLGDVGVEGETLQDIEGDSKDSVLTTALLQWSYPTGDSGTQTEFAIDPDRFHDAFASALSVVTGLSLELSVAADPDRAAARLVELPGFYRAAISMFGPGVSATVARESGPDLDVHIVTHDEAVVRIEVSEVLGDPQTMFRVGREALGLGLTPALVLLIRGGIDLVVLDVMLPGMDGYQLAGRLRIVGRGVAAGQDDPVLHVRGIGASLVSRRLGARAGRRRSR